MRTITNTTTDNLFELIQVIPAVKNNHLTNVTQIQTFTSNLRTYHDLHILAILITGGTGGVDRCGVVWRDFFRTREQDILGWLEGMCALSMPPFLPFTQCTLASIRMLITISEQGSAHRWSISIRFQGQSD